MVSHIWSPLTYYINVLLFCDWFNLIFKEIQLILRNVPFYLYNAYIMDCLCTLRSLLSFQGSLRSRSPDMFLSLTNHKTIVGLQKNSIADKICTRFPWALLWCYYEILWGRDKVVFIMIIQKWYFLWYLIFITVSVKKGIDRSFGGLV